ncbi:RidA family protein [Thermogladius sp.]|uniref:RidA family protein n=1 Tax=Thermogladius sp. TaxID=2023064 RepID=UPI003D0E5CCE
MVNKGVLSTRPVYSSRAPKPIGPYSQAVLVDGWLFVSGQIPVDPATGEVVRGDFRSQVTRVLENIKAIVEDAGGTLRDVVKVTVYLRDLSRVGEFNEVYAKYFGESPPARSLVGVSDLPRGVDVEVEVIARLKSGSGGE